MLFLIFSILVVYEFSYYTILPQDRSLKSDMSSIVTIQPTEQTTIFNLINEKAFYKSNQLFIVIPQPWLQYRYFNIIFIF